MAARQSGTNARQQKKPKGKGLMTHLGEFLRWMLLLALVTITIASLGLYFVHSQLDEEIRLYVQNKFQSHYPNLQVRVRSANRVEGSGIELRGLTLVEANSSGDSVPLVYVEELFAECGTEIADLAAGEVHATRLVMRGVKVRATRFADGTWSLARLWPLPKFGDSPPPTKIEGAFLDIVDLTGETPTEFSLRDITFELTPVASKDIAASLETPPAIQLSGSFAADHLRRVIINGQVNPSTNDWDVQGEVNGLDLTSETIDALPAELERLCSPLRVATGSTNFAFRYVKPNAATPATYNITGKFEGRVDDPRLPESLVGVSLPFQLTHNELKVQDAVANAGQTKFRMSGSIKGPIADGFSVTSPFAVRLKAEDVTLTDKLAKPLTGRFRDAWDKLSPQGVIDADVTVLFDGHEMKTSIVADLLDASVAFYKFPYRLHHAQGQVTFHENTLEVDHVRATANGRPVRVNGKLHDPGPSMTGWMDLTVDEPVPLDDKLFEAIQGKGEEVVRALNPQGMVRVNSRFERADLSLPPHQFVAIELLNCSMRYEKFQYPLYNITGTILMDDDEWTFTNLEGYNDSAFVTCSGTWKPDPIGGKVLVLNLNATDVPLEDELRNACAPNAQTFWHSLHPRGTIDHVRVNLRYEAASKDLSVQVIGQKRAADQNVEGRSITVKPSWLPYQLDDVIGWVSFQDGVAELKQVKGRHGKATMELTGRFETLPDEQWKFDATELHVDRLRATHELVAALPQRLGNAVSKLSFDGAVSISGRLGMQGMMGLPQPLSSNWSLNFDVEDGIVDCGARLEHIRGGMQLDGSLSQHGHQSFGQIAIDSMFYKGVQLTQVKGPLSIDDQFLMFGEKARRVERAEPPRHLRADTLGGILVGSGSVSMGPNNPYEFTGELLDGKLTKTMQELAPSRESLTGDLFASIRLNGNATGAHTVKGDGEIQLRQANLYQLPAMVRLLKLVKVKQPDKTAFTSSDIDFRVEADRIYLDRIDFNGDAINLRGRGEMTLDRAVNLTFTTSVLQRDGTLDQFLKPFFQDSGGLIEVSVTGTIDEPIITQGVNRAFQQLFPESPPQQQRMSRTPAPREFLDRMRSRR